MNMKRYRRISITLGVLACLLLAPSGIMGSSSTSVTIWYVKSEPIPGANCTSWTNACSLQYALINSTADYEIWVAAGIYKPTDDDNRSVAILH